MPPARAPFQQPQAGGGFLKSMAGGVIGGLLGGMLFSGLGSAGAGGVGSGGIGLIHVLLFAGIGYLVYRFVRKRKGESVATDSGVGTNQPYQGAHEQREGTDFPASYRYENSQKSGASAVYSGISHIQRTDPNFDEPRFNETVTEVFFKVQGAWMHRDLSPVRELLTDNMMRILQAVVDGLRRDRQINMLESMAVRNVELAEAWQESGRDYATARIQASLLDYITEEATGIVVSGSKTTPIKFEEYWTFIRPVGNNAWRLCAIDQR
jgi:predicted lipid-binding transport protein (Tim44 family)